MPDRFSVGELMTGPGPGPLMNQVTFVPADPGAEFFFVASALPLLFASVYLQMHSVTAQLVLLAMMLERRLRIRAIHLQLRMQGPTYGRSLRA
jgi:hypothetical protein